MGAKYAIGFDFGTESGRTLLIDVETGEEIGTYITHYNHGVIDEIPPTGKKLQNDWSLQDPADYMKVLYESVPEIIHQVQINPQEIIGIGVDFTSCTMLPLDNNHVPLCFNPKWSKHPHSWVKLWKHHAAQQEADEITHLAIKLGESFINRYGRKISSEWMFPKILQILRESPKIFEKTDLFLEACDWVVYRLTGSLVRSNATSGFKALWHKDAGYPDPQFLRQLDERLEHVADTKMRGNIRPIGSKAGELTKEMADRMGLPEGIPVAVGIIDSHAAVPAVGAVRNGQLVMTMGTSTCHMLLSDKKKMIKGITGVVEDGIIPGFYGYEAGQAAVGDIFAWFVNHSVPEYVKQQAMKEGLSIHKWLEREASTYKPGQSGLLALDWWNGSRILADSDLTGLIVGLTLGTKPEEIYRALLEATAFGTRKIIESFVEAGIEVDELFACGGLPQRNELLMQIYADVMNREIKIADSKQSSAYGAAMFGAVVAGKEKGGYNSIFEAADKIAKVKEKTYTPVPEHVKIYDQLYEEYKKLHNYFGCANNTMKNLKKLKLNCGFR
ncbi:ribulokinase [Scopulibacillus cellulosilyticus]|uniref:Ribulokinase n=1 Tax=Scopulibacillus cellulosilyticus TaxID=2665665 RepID=A0ABW2Q4F3_9BACL